MKRRWEIYFKTDFLVIFIAQYYIFYTMIPFKAKNTRKNEKSFHQLKTNFAHFWEVKGNKNKIQILNFRFGKCSLL